MKNLIQAAILLLLSTPLFAQEFNFHWQEEGPNTSNAQLGRSIATGDIDGDGWDDLVIGEPNSDEIHIYYGTPTGFPESADYTISGPSTTYKFGQSITLGDFDDDGYDDVAVSRVSSAATTGSVYVFFGSSTGILYNNWTTINGNTGQKFGISLSSSGDFDDGGHDDLAIGAPEDDQGWTNGSAGVYVFYGENLPKPNTGLHPAYPVINASGADWDVEYASTYEEFGWAVEITGDLSGDNVRDLAVSDPFKDNEGRVFIYGFDGGSDPEELTIIEGETNSEFGKSLTRIGNVSGDSKPDLLIGAPANATTLKSGEAYVFLGETTVSAVKNWDDLSDADWNFTGVGQTDAYFGIEGVRLDDVNLDGKMDFAISARRYDDGANNEAGLVRVYFGTGSTTQPTSFVDIIGDNADDNLGHALARYKFQDRPMVAIASPRYDNATTSEVGLVQAYELSQWNKIYTECLDGDFSGYSRMKPVQMIPNDAGNMTMLALKLETSPNDDFDRLAAITEFDNTGFIEDQNYLSLPTLAGGYDQVFDPKSIVEVAAGEYLIYGERLFETASGDDYDLMVVYYDNGTVDWAKTYTFSSGDDKERAVKAVKLTNSSGTHVGYSLLAKSTTNGKIDSRVISIGLTGSVNWSKSLESNSTYKAYVDPNDMIQVYDGGDIFVSGESDVEGTAGGVIYALEYSAGTWRYINGYEESANNTRLDVAQIQSDGYDVIGLFTNSYNNAAIHLNPVNLELRQYTTGGITYVDGFVFNSSITKVSFVPDGDNNDYVVSGEVSSNSQDILTFYVDDATEEWNKVLEQTGEERDVKGAIRSGKGDYWAHYRTRSHSTDCGVSPDPRHMAMVSYDLSDGATSPCEDDYSTVNVADLDLDNDDNYTEHFTHVDLQDPTATPSDDYYDIESFTTTATTFDEDDFTVTADPIPAAYLCGDDLFSAPFDGDLDDDATVITETKIEDVNIRIYPNPAISQLNIEVSSAEGTVRVISLNGKEVMPATNLNQELNQLDISNLTEGLYLLEIQTAKGITTQKFIKK